MKILIYGNQAWIASHFSHYLKQQEIEYCYGYISIFNESNITNEINHNFPTHVVVFLENNMNKLDHSDLFLPNTINPIIIHRICESKGIHFTLITTGMDCMYESKRNLERTISEPPIFPYETSQMINEQYFKNILSNSVCIFRLYMPYDYTQNKNNYLQYVIELGGKYSTFEHMYMSSIIQLPHIVISHIKDKIGGFYAFRNRNKINPYQKIGRAHV